MEEGVIPNICKKAVIVPIFKRGKKTKPSNYLPISMTSVLLKIFERIIGKHLIKFLNACLSALLNIFDTMLLNIAADQSSCVDMIYLDFSKVFDKVDHGVLMHKLKHLGITGNLGFLGWEIFCRIVHNV